MSLLMNDTRSSALTLRSVHKMGKFVRQAIEISAILKFCFQKRYQRSQKQGVFNFRAKKVVNRNL